MTKEIPQSFISGGYLIPTMALARICSFLITMLIKLLYAVYTCVTALRQVIPGAVSPMVGKSPNEPGHYIFDLRPEYGRITEFRTRRRILDRFIRGKHVIPTILLANVSQLLLSTSKECLYGLREAVSNVLGIIRLQTRPSVGDATHDDTSDVVHNHYIFDLRPEYGSDVKEMLYNVLKNYQLPYFIRKLRKRPKPRKYIVKCGWRRELVNSERRRGTRKSTINSNKTINQSSLQAASFTSASTMNNTQDMDKEEKFELVPPIQDTDKEVSGIEFPVCTGQTTYVHMYK